MSKRLRAALSMVWIVAAIAALVFGLPALLVITDTHLDANLITPR
ncbi:hypothetical protein [Mycobacterium sp. URHB0021]